MAFPLFAPRPPQDVPANTRLAKIVGPGAGAYARGREVAALLFWTLALFLGLALGSYVDVGGVSTGGDWVGPVGAAVARALVSAVGIIAWSLPFEAVLLGIPFVRGKRSLITPARVAGDIVILILAAALVQVGWPGKTAFGDHAAGGAVGELFGELARSLFSTIGSFLVGFALLGLILIGRASFSFIALVNAIAHLGKTGALGTATGAKSVAEAWRAARQIEKEKAEAERIAKLPKIDLTPTDDATIAILPLDRDGDDTLPIGQIDQPPVDAGAKDEPKRKRAPRKKKDAAPGAPSDAPCDPGSPVEAALDANANANATPEPPAVAPTASIVPTAADAKPELKARAAVAKKKSEMIDTSTLDALKVEKLEKGDKLIPAIGQGFRLPPLDFLVPAKVDTSALIDKDALFKSAELLAKTLGDYGVTGKVEDILPGPTVTTFEVSPAAGTKVSKVASLADDLALALAKKVRIVAPIPGKNRIGFELPNEKRIPVNLRDLVEDRRFQQMDAPLPVVLGRDILGNPVYADLASMPHVIVAGATGAGKSVGLNVMLTSLLYRRSPEEMRLLMIDPKVVELAPFDRIPHMLLPVVTDMKQASNALKWAVDEMERRYQLFADAGTKNISTYNAWVDRVCRGEARNPFPKRVIAKDHNGLPEELPPEKGTDEGEAPLPERMPLIVIVVDEFADLMMQQGKDVETAVARLAQKARAAGMHVILATQRPSVDVITGMIKANFPTRIAYRVAQKVDSRTILDEQGAEHLLGRGDMLIKLNGTNETRRVQCPMISEEELHQVTDFLRTQGEPVYDENILKPRDDEDGDAVDDDAEKDPMYDDAVRVVAETRRCSTSWLQRKLGLGYNRAARIVETMERRGIVGPANGAKDREVLIGNI
jgi:DNA segregation ATPase FtsK/SpoIIIE, S-DNA-T family